MKHLMLFLMIISPINLYALPCPNGRGILYKNDSIATVLSQCGEPNSKKTYMKALNNSEEWTYYKPTRYTPGTIQLTVFLNNDIVTNIRIIERYRYFFCRNTLVNSGVFVTTQSNCGNAFYDTRFTDVCGTAFGVGATAQAILSICGQPSETFSSQIEVTEFYYTNPSSQTVVFENGRVVEFR